MIHTKGQKKTRKKRRCIIANGVPRQKKRRTRRHHPPPSRHTNKKREKTTSERHVLPFCHTSTRASNDRDQKVKKKSRRTAASRANQLSLSQLIRPFLTLATDTSRTTAAAAVAHRSTDESTLLALFPASSRLPAQLVRSLLPLTTSPRL